ncbi:hypothetical protein [Oceanirhabdus sp. W0125-5]|uniref:hypothetical protein n=1 Tax=Oceanirhabdus sp. W0125-5 TaxID=2999116 RepID=UPI0022F2B7F2|nr:hypothetical protein [Oceanirhabdus sp. W0125-5]WBW97753.1 hypothetical protein OW730_02940 [Oceanirhabdus sp. W0125-5]
MRQSLMKKLLYISNMEDYFNRRYILDIAIVCFVLILSFGDTQQKLMGHLFLLFWISTTTCQLYTLFYRKKCDFLLFTSNLSNNNQMFITLKCSLVQNLIPFIFMIFYLIFLLKFNVFNGVVFSVIYFFYAVAIGVFMGRLLNNYLGIILIILFYGRCFLNGWFTSDEVFRYISPTLQLYSPDMPNIPNIYTLCVLTVILLVLGMIFSKYSINSLSIKNFSIVCICLTLIIGVIPYEIWQNKIIQNAAFNKIEVEEIPVKFKGIDEETALKLASIIKDVENRFIDFGMATKSEEIQIIRGYIPCLRWLAPIYETRPIPIIKKDGKVYITVFSNAMLNLENDDIMIDWIMRIFGTTLEKPKYQDNYYAHQIAIYCRVIVENDIINNGNVKYSSEVREFYSNKEVIKRLEQTENVMLKNIYYLLQKSPSDISKIYKKIINQVPKNDDEFIMILNEY